MGDWSPAGWGRAKKDGTMDGVQEGDDSTPKLPVSPCGGGSVSTAADDSISVCTDPLGHTSLHAEVSEAVGSLEDQMRQGSILFSWECGLKVKKVPYYVVPDAWAKDIGFVERVVSGMKLKMPNMVLSFNPIKHPISRWNREWDYSSPNASSPWEVDEEILPLELPAGQSCSVKAVADYMSRVVDDRVMDILEGVSAACVQARAWLMVTGKGMYDFAPQILSRAADKNSAIIATYCMEDFATPIETGTALDCKSFEMNPPVIKDRVPGGKSFCESLHKFAGISSDDEDANKPKMFVEDIDDVMDAFRKMQAQTVEPIIVKNFSGTKKGKTQVETSTVKDQKSCIRFLDRFFTNRAYLPPKDVSRLIVFQSREAAETFKLMLEARVSTGNFLVEGSVEAMDMFDVSMKTGKPVFIMGGVGGASDRMQMVLQHMKYRKMLDMHGSKEENGKDDNVEEHQPETAGTAGCWSIISSGGKSNRKVHPSPQENAEVPVSVVEKDQVVEEGGLVDLEIKITRGLEIYGDVKSASGEMPSDMFEALDKQSRALWLTKLQRRMKTLREDFEGVLSLPKEQLLDTTGNQIGRLKEQLRAMHVEADKILKGHVDRNLVQKAANGTQGGPETSKVGVLGNNALSMHFTVDAGEAADEGGAVVMTGAQRKAKASTPEGLYYHELKVGKAGLKFESKLGCEYLGPREADYNRNPGGRGRKSWSKMQQIIEDMPLEWQIPDESDPECERGVVDDGQGLGPVRVPCGMEICPDCSKIKRRKRVWLRALAKGNHQQWEALSSDMQRKYISLWMDDHPLTQSDRDVLDPKSRMVAKHAMTIFSNVYEPPIPDACVSINVLEKDLNIESIMDDVTSAMSISSLVNEVGEKKAFRQRLLMAWQMVKQLMHNAKIQKRREHVLNILIILFTFLSILSGTLAYEAREEMKRGGVYVILNQLHLEGQSLEHFVAFLQLTNLLVPMLTTFFLGLNSAMSPASKYLALYHQALHVESEIYKVRARIGDYSPHIVTGIAPSRRGNDTGKEGEADEKKDQKKTTAAAQIKNPRILFAERMDSVWTDLGASEVRQESLGEPSDLKLLDLNKTIKVQVHPSLFEQGHVLLSKNKKTKTETLERLTYEFEDDGLKVLSTQDYVDLRVTPFENMYANRAERLCWQLQVFQLFIFVLTSISTLLGAMELPQWIPVSLGLGSVFSAILAYQGIESRMERVNAANISLRKLMIWWHGLSVIEKRIPSNKTSLVETMESIIQAEAGSVVLDHNDDEGSKGDGAEGGGSEK